uniref:NADH dehydrogenase subunit 6 n=1 Tax=Endeis sp. JZ-2022 TaxID=2992007 RepID=A0A9E7V7E0_9CHEL|nr:NADH dehydrogenase subunit 6 [Endeis sp. JZ-2022]
MKMIMMMMITMTTMMACNYPPFMLVMIILSQTLLCSMMMWMMAQSFWMAYILMLIFLGGMLVIFVYMASINSNQKFDFKFSMMKMNILSVALITLYTASQMSSELMMGSPHYKSLTNNINKMYESSSSMTTLIMAIYLMMTLFILVMLSKKFKGPLKSK